MQENLYGDDRFPGQPVQNKIVEIQDALCYYCAQAYQGECRAFQVPHSDTERKQREGDPQGLCEIPFFAWAYKPGMKLAPEDRKL